MLKHIETNMLKQFNFREIIIKIIDIYESMSAICGKNVP